MKQFLSKGVKAVKMDDIAMSLSISKRTLYEIFADKEDLLMLVSRNMKMITMSGWSVLTMAHTL